MVLIATDTITAAAVWRLELVPGHRDSEVERAAAAVPLARDGRAPGLAVFVANSRRRRLRQQQCLFLPLGRGRLCFFLPGEGSDRGVHLRQHADED